MKIAGLCAKAYNKLPNEFTYQGNYAEEEAETGYEEFALRHYDPTIGRWLSTDPYDEFASPYVGMGADPVNNVDPDGGSILGDIGGSVLGTIGKIFKNLFGGGGSGNALVGRFSLSGSSASSSGSGSSIGGDLANGTGNAIAGVAGQWVANKLFPLPSGPDASALQQIADIRKQNEAIPSILQSGLAGGGNPAGALRTWQRTHQLAGWIELLGGGPENLVADALAGGVEVVGTGIALLQLAFGTPEAEPEPPKSSKGGKEPNDKGKQWEEQNDANKGSEKERYEGPVSGKNRIADKSNEKSITEMKVNDSYVQHLSKQIKDGIQHAMNTGREYILKLTRPDKITKPLKDLRDQNKLKIQ